MNNSKTKVSKLDASRSSTVGYFYIIKNLSSRHLNGRVVSNSHLNGRVVCLNARHENHPNLEGPIEGREIQGRWLTQDAI